MSDDRWKPKPVYVPPDTKLDQDLFYPPKPEPEPVESTDLRDVFYRNDTSVVEPFARDVSDYSERLAAHQGLSPAERLAPVKAMAYLAHDAKIPRTDAKALFRQVVEYTVRPPSEAIQLAWKAETLQAIETKYGDRTPDVLEKTNALLNTHPDVARMLEAAGMLNNPDVILTLARSAGR